MVKYYGRARQRTGAINRNQPGLKQQGCNVLGIASILAIPLAFGSEIKTAAALGAL